MSREQILASLRTSLAGNKGWLEAESKRAPHAPPPHVLPPADDLAEQFAAELRKLEGRAYLVADEEGALEVIDGLLTAKNARQAITWDLDQIRLPGLDALLKQRSVESLSPMVQGDVRKSQLQALEPAQVCISGADLAIAESASLVVRHGPGRPRLASLLAPYHIAVIRRSQLVRGLGEALEQLQQQHGADLFTATSNLTFITGPSRTADIEMTLSLGIHGPPEIHVVIID